MKYDMEIVLSVVNNKEVYRNRFNEFKRVGLLNIPHGTRLKVVLLVEKGTADAAMLQGWPADVKVLVKEYEHGLHIHKLCHYYLNLVHFEARWYVGFDDDSVTNVGGLMRVLERYNWRNPVYLSEMMPEKPGGGAWIERDLLKRLGLWHLVFPNLDHDWEAHYLSRQGLINILKNPACLQYIEERSKILDGFSDQFLNFCGRIAKVKFHSARWFSSPHPKVKRFSLFGGDLHHIHYIAPDYDNTHYFHRFSS